MRQPEQRLWDSMRRNAPRDWWLHRIENLCVAGMPDVVLCTSSHDWVWVELKAPQRPQRPTSRLLSGGAQLRKEQIAWHAECARRGARSYILVRDDARELYVAEGAAAAELNGRTLAEWVQQHGAPCWGEVFMLLDAK